MVARDRFWLCCCWLVASLGWLVWSPAARAGTTSFATESASLLSSTLNRYETTLGPYSGGVWQSTNTTCWACNNGGPATAAATSYVIGGEHDPTLLKLAEQTVDTAIATRQMPDGSFQPPPNSGDGQSAAIRTMFFGVEFGTVDRLLSPYLDPTRKAAWRASLVAATDYETRTGNLTWYTNGNINLGMAELCYLTWVATGLPRYEASFTQAWNFALYPPQSRWPGLGLVLTKTPTRLDGADGAGYLTETGVGGTGFDADYTMLQADIASRMYLLTRAPDVGRLTNLLLNQLLPRVNSAYQLDTSGGTRHPEQGRLVGFLSSAPDVLAMLGGRADLTPMLNPLLKEEKAYYAQPWQAYNPFLRRGLGNSVSVTALVAQHYRP